MVEGFCLLVKTSACSGDAVPFFSLMELSEELALFLTRSSTCFPTPRDKCSGIHDSESRTGPAVWKIGLLSQLWSWFALDFTEPPCMNFSLSEQCLERSCLDSGVGDRHLRNNASF